MTMFRTLHDRILVKQDKAPEKIGLILVPDSAQVPPNRGEVIAANADRDVVVGERILFIKDAGSTVAIGDEKRLIMYEQDIYGVLENGTLRPIGTKVLIEPDPPAEKIGRILIPDNAQESQHRREALASGKVVAIGPGMRKKGGGRWPGPDVKVGQRVLYYHNYTPNLTIEGKTYVCVADDQLRAAIEEE